MFRWLKSSPSEEPSSIGHYKITARLGAGGMGVVYAARDERLGRSVAIKMILKTSEDPRARERLWREARSAARVNHPNVCQVHEVGEWRGEPYIVMELLEGEALAERLTRGALLVEVAIRIALDLLAGLTALHRRGLLHRDLKPSNIFLTPHGIKLLDFGVARISAQADETKTQGFDLPLTAAGALVGTPRYMSPEQFQGQDLDARTDLFAVGAILHEMVTGKPVFSGKTAVEVFHAILYERPPQLGGPLAFLDRILARALAKRPEERYASAEAMAEDLRSALATAAIEERGEFRGTTLKREQEIRFCATRDGIRIAYATVGEGSPLVKAANWLNHLEFDWRSPVWRHWFQELAKDHFLVRYDERGCGLSDWNAEDLSFEAWVRDLESVVEAVGVERFALLGISQGGPVAIAYAVRHPERVTHLVLYGSYGRGWAKRPLSPEAIERRRALLALTRQGWGLDNPAFRQVWTTLFMPDATMEQMRWFNDLQRTTTSPENAARLQAAFSQVDVVDLLPQVVTPALVLHSRGDAVIPFEEGRQVAVSIPGARFVALESRNHLLLESEPAWQIFLGELRRFLGTKGRLAQQPSPA